jgi:hypothetical protein
VVDVSRPTNAFAARKKRSALDDLPRTAVWVAGIVAVLGVLIFGGVQVWAIINRPPAPVQAPPNAAARMLDQNAPPLEILDAAMHHQRRYPSEEGMEVLDRARANVSDTVETLLDAEPYSRQNLREAQRLANEAYLTDPSEPLLALKGYVAEEVRDYSLILLDTGESGPRRTATVRYASAAGDEELQVAEGDTLLDGRFEVKAVLSSEVQLADAERGGRRLRLTRTGGLSAL